MEGIKVDVQKRKAVPKCPKLANVADPRNFFDLAGYCRALRRIFQR